MKILFLTNHLNAGGITSYLANLAGELARNGHTCWIASSGGNACGRFASDNITLLDVPCLKTKCEIDPRLLFSLPGLLAMVKPLAVDIVHAQTRVSAMAGAWIGLRTGVPLVVTGHGFFKTHPGRRILPLWGRETIAISPPVALHLKQVHLLPADRIHTVANGIDGNIFKPASPQERSSQKKRFGIPEGIPVIGCIARLSDVKGHIYLIQAMPRILESFPNCQCVFFGEGPMEQSLRQEIQRLKLNDRVSIHPVCSETSRLMCIYDVGVMPSLAEGLGLSILEAQSAELPVVASKTGGIPDAVADGVTGRLVPPADPAAIADAVLYYLKNPEQARHHGRSGRELILKKFALDKMARDTLAVYQKARHHA